MKGLVLCTFLVLCLFSTSVMNQCTQVDHIYNGCFCFFEWNDANKVGNWSFEENWLQLVEPAIVGFVSVAGDNTVTVNEERRINELYVGPNRWDTTRLVIDEDLTVVYDDYPVIFSVRTQRLVSGQVRFVIRGKGFGFVSEDIQVSIFQEHHSATDYNVDNYMISSFDCEDVTLAYRDAVIQCNLIPGTQFYPGDYAVVVHANGYISEPAEVSVYLQ